MNLTIVVDDDILKRARVRALEEDTSVNALLRAYLTAYAGVDQRRDRKPGTRPACFRHER